MNPNFETSNRCNTYARGSLFVGIVACCTSAISPKNMTVTFSAIGIVSGLVSLTMVMTSRHYFDKYKSDRLEYSNSRLKPLPEKE